MNKEIHLVTGAFGYSGKYIAKRLLNSGLKVRTLTNSPDRQNEFGNQIEIFKYNFNEPEKLIDAMRGVSVLYNTYWVRFNYTDFKFSIAVENTIKLFDAAKKAGVKRIIHTSITNPTENSPLQYFSGKALLEKTLIGSGISYSILRPAVLFGKEDILINNIAWLIKKFPIFCMPGDGKYKLQPIYVDDFALLAVEQGQMTGNYIIDAIGSETFSYKELIQVICKTLNKTPLIVSVPDNIIYYLGLLIGKITGDIVITRDEIKGLKSNLLFTDSKPTGATKFTEWLKENSNTIGTKYASELARRKDRKKSYH